jgi:DNA repair protein RadA/Sms
MAQYSCTNCGYGSASWYGKCPECGEWNTLQKEEEDGQDAKQTLKTASFVDLSKISPLSSERTKTKIFELDRVLGGGFVKSEVILLAGEPGVGKSTLLLSCLQHLRTAYISGEESGQQIKQRAERINVKLNSFMFTNDNQAEGIISSLEKIKDKFDIIVIDSIQTIYSKDVTAAIASVAQLKEVSVKLIDFAKRSKLPMILIGHITKEGEIAGPKILEHLVDCVLYLEGEKISNFRILRANKNRFGPTDEVGIFEMNEKGLQEVTNPTIFLDQEANTSPGKTTVGVMEGTRPLFFEVQALAVPTVLPVPRRVVRGVDYNKVQLLLAVIRKNLNLSLDQFDMYINVVGGVNIKSTAVDLGIITAVVSSIKNLPVSEKKVFTGEVGLLGETRKVLFQDKIILEAKRLGFTQVYSPKNIKSVREVMSIFK